MNETQFKLLIESIKAQAIYISLCNMGQDVGAYEGEDSRYADDNLAESFGLPRYNLTEKD